MRIESAHEKTQGKQESRDLSLHNTDLLLVCVLVLLPGVADRSEFTSAVVIYLPLEKTWFLPCVACPCDCIYSVTLLNPPSINRLTL